VASAGTCLREFGNRPAGTVPTASGEEESEVNDWLLSHARPVVDSLLYAVIGSVILVLAVTAVNRLLPFSMKKEIEEDHNVAFGIILGAIILGLSIIIAAAIH
jgi:hypothetical protein